MPRLRHGLMLPLLQQQMNRLLDEMDAGVGGSEELGGGTFTPAVDVQEDADAYTILVELPGVVREDINLNLQDSVLTIKGEKKRSSEFEPPQYRREEREFGTFARSLALPRNVDSDKVHAHLAEGVLQVRIPKREEAKPRQIAIGTTQDAAVAHEAGTTQEAA